MNWSPFLYHNKLNISVGHYLIIGVFSSKWSQRIMIRPWVVILDKCQVYIKVIRKNVRIIVSGHDFMMERL